MTTEALVINDKSTTAESLLTEGSIRGELGDPQAEVSFAESFFLAEEIGDTLVGAQAALDLMHRSTLRFDMTAAWQWERHARALTKRLADDQRPEHPFLVASYWSILGTLHAWEGRLEEAESAYTKALRKIEALPEDNRAWQAGVHNNLGNVYVRRGNLESAAEELETSAQIYRDVLGAHHPSYAVALNNLGELLMRRHAWDEARARYEEAHAIFLAALGPEHPHIGIADNNLGDVFSRIGDRGVAADFYNQAISIFSAAFGEDAPPLAYPLTGLGELRLSQGRRDESLELLTRALALRGSDNGPELAHTRFALARALGPEQLDRAVDLASQAREGYAAGGPGYARELGEVDAWIHERAPK